VRALRRFLHFDEAVPTDETSARVLPALHSVLAAPSLQTECITDCLRSVTLMCDRSDPAVTANPATSTGEFNRLRVTALITYHVYFLSVYCDPFPEVVLHLLQRETNNETVAVACFDALAAVSRLGAETASSNAAVSSVTNWAEDNLYDAEPEVTLFLGVNCSLVYFFVTTFVRSCDIPL
jgi:hypothetical protein